MQDAFVPQLKDHQHYFVRQQYGLYMMEFTVSLYLSPQSQLPHDGQNSREMHRIYKYLASLAT